MSDGLANQCKKCVKEYAQINAARKAEYQKNYRENNKEHLDAKSREYYFSNKEVITIQKKILYQNNKETILVTSKVYREENREKLALNSKKYYSENKENILDKSKVYYQNNKSHMIVKAMLYRTRNPEKIKTYLKNNPEKTSSHSHKRRALKRNCEGYFTHADIKLLILKQNGLCVYCKKDLILEGDGKYHIDHRTPLKLGGSNFPVNLQLLCPKCNCSKGAKDLNEYEKSIGHNLEGLPPQ